MLDISLHFILKFKNDRSHHRIAHPHRTSRARTELGVFTPPSFDAIAAAPFSFAGVVDMTRRRTSSSSSIVAQPRHTFPWAFGARPSPSDQS
jgi:hypothetical protein